MKRATLFCFIVLSIIVSGCSSTSEPNGTVTLRPTPASTRQPTGTVTRQLTATPSLEPTRGPTAKEEDTANEVEDLSSEDTAFRITYRAELGKDSIEEVTYFWNDHVIFVPGETTEVSAIVDLAAMSWYVTELDQTILLSDCEDWAKASAEMSEDSLSKSTDETLKRCVESLLHPDFEVDLTESGALVLTNDFLVYRISSSQSIPEHALDKFFSFDRLNACVKALLDRTFPPFAQLAASEALAAHSMFPNQIELTLKTPQGDQVVKTSSLVERMTESEQEMVESLLTE